MRGRMGNELDGSDRVAYSGDATALQRGSRTVIVEQDATLVAPALVAGGPARPDVLGRFADRAV